MSRRYRLPAITLAFVFAFLCLLQNAFAQAGSTSPSSFESIPEDATPLRPERGIISLQSNDAEEEEREILFQPRVSQYRDMLIAPVASWIAADLMRARIFSSLDFSWTYGEQWQEKSKQNVTRSSLDAQHALMEPSSFEGGFPFGSAKALEEEKNPEKLAAKILWNMASVQRSSGAIGIDARIAWVGAQSILRDARAFLFRTADKKIIPTVYQREDADKVAAYELFRFVAPAAVSGYTTASIRYETPDEDRLLHYSPVIDSQRELLSSHRGDEIVDGLLSLDDLFGFSQKVESVKARVVAEKSLLLPFPSLVAEIPTKEKEMFAELAGTEGEGGGAMFDSVRGKHQMRDGRPTSVRWNFDIQAFKQHAPWLPLTMFLVPRDVWVLELFPKDPYHPYGKQILIVDKESMLPFYKIVHAPDGALIKTLVAAWGYVNLDDQEPAARATAFPSFVFAVDRGARSATTMNIQRIQIFSESPATADTGLGHLLSIPKKAPAEDDGKQ